MFILSYYLAKFLASIFGCSLQLCDQFLATFSFQLAISSTMFWSTFLKLKLLKAVLSFNLIG